MLNVTIDQPRRLQVWRVGYKPDPWVWADWTWATDGRFPGRWDDRDGNFRTIYVGSTLLACLLEVLADFRPDQQLAAEMTDIDVVDDDEAMYPTVPAGRIDPTWLKPRVSGSAKLTGDFCWVTTAQTLAALHPHFVAAALQAGLRDFDAAALKDSRPRELTQSVATYLYARTDLDGIRFASRHGDDLELWAIFERDTSASPCLDDTAATELAADDPALMRAFEVLGLAWVGLKSTAPSPPPIPLPLEQVTESEAFRAIFGDTPPTPETPIGAAYLWSAAVENPQTNLGLLTSLAADAGVWGDFTQARDALANRSLMQHPIHSVERPGEISYVKFIEVSGAARAFDDMQLNDVWILTMIKQNNQWYVWSQSHNYLPPADSITWP